MIFPTAPLPIIDHPADHNHCCGVPRIGYRFIVLHGTGGTDSLAWLSTTSPTNKPVSAQRLIDKYGTNYKIVPDDQVAYTQGYSVIGPVPANGEDANELGLSIEFENLNDGKDPFTEAQLNTGADQVVEWWGAHGFAALVLHKWIDKNKHDPADNFDLQDFYRRIWDRLADIAVSMYCKDKGIT